MNKTVNINLGGMFFHIDEDAFQKLNRYFEAVKRSLSNSTGKDEIMKDIEMRIAELLTEKSKGEKQVVGIRDVEEIITVMGQPEDYRIDDENTSEEPSLSYTSSKRAKKLYRDTEKGMLGGVLAGFGHYLGVDALWLRILMVILVFTFGTGILVYLLLWILMPAAVTTTEKLEMTGEPVTISNIEKKVREEFENISDKFKSVDYDKFGKHAKTGAEKFGNNLSEIILRIFSILGKVIGAFLVVCAASTLVSLILFVITTGSISFTDFPWQNYVENYIEYPLWGIGLLTLGAIGIPFFFLLILGLKLLISNMKSIGNAAKYTLLAIWVISVGALIALGLKQATQIAFDAKTVQKQKFELNPKDTLYIKFAHNDYYAKNIEDNHEFLIAQDSTGKQVIYSNNIRFHIVKTDDKTPYIQIEKEAQGKSFQEAKQRAEQIRYSFKVDGNHLIFDNYLITEVKNKYRDQEVEIFLYLPEGVVFKPDASVRNYDHTDNSFFDLWYDSDNHIYKMETSKVNCLNCPDENEEDFEISEDGQYSVSVEGDSIQASMIVDENGVKIESNSKKANQSNGIPKGLRKDKDGVIIKNN
ncbi:PspC domain-containing protein [uncultured Flavobacterium sp.]|uniref:PspC domain-containing protein n=1 Tax=uncultured Flavobacterium sp. TaxID=165435 RepID=UPI0025E2FB37|nr:PspC domain-containing protein [uncultured Flavobacterium sp.]